MLTATTSLIVFPVSHTTDDLVFEWFPPEETPLVVESIELPQLELIANYTGDKNIIRI